MRNILFRGVIQDEKGFVYGKLVYNNIIRSTKKVFDRFEYSHDVTSDIKIKPETVGQFTGLTDKNGVKIFDGDKLTNSQIVKIVKWSDDHEGKASWCWAWESDLVSRDSFELWNPMKQEYCDEFEIIGNIHEGGE